MTYTAHRGSSRQPALDAGVSLLPMAWDTETPDRLRDMSYRYTTDLAAVRAVVYRYAKQAGLPEHRAQDLVLAVSEVAANTVRHAKSPGSLKIWYDSDEIVCQVQDEGVIHDPLAGRRKPAMDAMGGHGLWIVHQVCDDVEMQSDEDGTTIRLHMKLPRLRPDP
jgi:anti-sigma regulatory factor (Ser/Thr protein kinase)